MSGERRDQREQEISIKRREHELFRSHAEDASASPAKPFADYLRETPSAPLSLWVKAGLWALSVVVAVLFAAALWRSQHRPPPQGLKKGRPKAASNVERFPTVSISIALMKPSPGVHARLASSPHQENP